MADVGLTASVVAALPGARLHYRLVVMESKTPLVAAGLRDASGFVDKVPKDAKPAELPVARTSEALGIKVPADRG
jgi:hypothetical protein